MAKAELGSSQRVILDDESQTELLGSIAAILVQQMKR